MRRNHQAQAQAAVEPSWWSHDTAGVAPPDDPNNLDDNTPDPWDYDPAPEADPQAGTEAGTEAEPPLLTHTAPLRLLEPAATDEPTPAPVQPAASPAGAAVGILDPGAVQLATCYAIDYLSWDATNPDRRATALARYRPGHTPVRPQASGWSGRGRQRASFAVAGAARRDDADPGVLWVDVRVLITCYQPDPARPPAVPAADPGELACDVSSAPAPDAPGWRALDSTWVHIQVPLVHDPAGHPHIRPDLQPATHQQPIDHEPTEPGPHSLTVVPATVPTEEGRELAR